MLAFRRGIGNLAKGQGAAQESIQKEINRKHKKAE
jgi:hypothetical protein